MCTQNPRQFTSLVVLSFEKEAIASLRREIESLKVGSDDGPAGNGTIIKNTNIKRPLKNSINNAHIRRYTFKVR